MKRAIAATSPTYLRNERLTSRSLWELVSPLISDGRDLKQLTGSEKCQCREARSQRNHLACCYHAWLSLKVKAKHLDKTLYQVKTDLLRNLLRPELRNPWIPAFQPA